MFYNLSNVAFLTGSEERLSALANKFRLKHQKINSMLHSLEQTELNISESEAYKKLLKARHIAEGGFHRSRTQYRAIRVASTIRHYQDSDFGVKMMRENGGIYREVFKMDNRSDIDCWLFDMINTVVPTKNIFKPIEAREFIRYCEEYPSEVSTPALEERLKKAMRVRSEELHQHRSKFGWVVNANLSVYHKDFAWLTVRNSGLKKLSVVVNLERNKLKFNRNVEKWQGVIFQITGDFSNHNVPKNWIMIENGDVYPVSYVRRKNLKVRTAIADSPAMIVAGRFNSTTLAFSHRSGWYNSSDYTAYRGKIYNHSDLTTLSDGEKVLTEHARFVNRHNAYFHKDKCVKLRDGSFELTIECISYDGDWYHRTTTEFRRCGLCGNTHPTSSFRQLIADDEDSHVCGNCHDTAKHQLIRMCYSTDVIDHKGFGSTNLKINGESIYLGLELETYADYNDENQTEVSMKLNAFAASKENTYTVPTRDGSLCSNHGVEYIFRPEGLIQQKRNVNHFMQKMNGLLAEDAGDGYGLHIHVSDNFLSSTDKVRIDNFVSMYEKYFRMIGGRSETEYQRPKQISSNKYLSQHQHNKYKMVNIGRSGTIEYRFPKSLVNEVHVSMNLEMAQAITMYVKYRLSSAKLDTRSEKPEALKGFIEYVSENKKTYPLLNAENNAKIKLDNLEKYSEFCKKALKAKVSQQAHDESYTLAA